MEKQSRLRSKVMWISIISSLALLAGEWGLYDVFNINEGTIRHTIDFIFLVLTAFGVLNDPTSKDSF